jgi:hypothetical protein
MKPFIFLVVGVLCLAGVTFAEIQAEYFNVTEGGPPSNAFDARQHRGTRIDAGIDFDWGTGGPDFGGLEADRFAVRWRGQIYLPATGAWTFYTYSDDGARLWIDGQAVIDQWVDQAPTLHASSPATYSEGWHDLRMEYYENGGGASAQLQLSGPGFDQQVVPSANLRPQYGLGLMGEYHGQELLAGAILQTRVDGPIDFDWGETSPGPGIDADHFSVRWRGKVYAPVSGLYTFTSSSDDGVDLYINGVRIIHDLPNAHGVEDRSGSLHLKGGVSHFIEMHYNEITGGAVLRLRWTPPGGTSQLVPEANLRAVMNEAPSDLVLSSTYLADDAGADALVGTLYTYDPDNETIGQQSHSYALVAGEGSDDNGLFTVNEDQLLANESLLLTDQAEYQVRIRTTDDGVEPEALSLEKTFTIILTELPVFVRDLPAEIFVSEREELELEVIVAGTIGPVSYQWYRNVDEKVSVPLMDGNGVFGATTATLTIPYANPSHEGMYFVQVSDERSTVDSSQATVTVGPKVLPVAGMGGLAVMATAMAAAALGALRRKK